MDPLRPDPRPGALSDLEARLLAANVGGRLFDRPAEPVQLGRYRVLGRLGQGGMGVVFRAHDPQLRRDVAVKLLHAPRGAPEREQHARLRREALALGRLSHPNVVQVFEVGEADGHVYIVMELVRGTTLRAWLATPRAPAEVLAMLAQVARGLAAAHAAGVVHRDLKPENVLVGADGRARIVDFGLARAAPSGEAGPGSLAAPLTRTGALLGTPAFMAPEQVADPTRADARADQFSFAVLAWEALTGERPYADLQAAAVGAARPAPATLPPDLRDALLRGLRPDPDDRWPTLDPLLAALERPPPAPPRPTSARLLLAALAAATAAAIAAPLYQSHRHAEREQARRAAIVDRVAAADAIATHLPAVLADDPPLAAAAALARARATDEASAWAHAYVLAADDAARRTALRGLALALQDDSPVAVRILLAGEAPDLLADPDLAALAAADERLAEPQDRLVADAHAGRLAADADTPLAAEHADRHAADDTLADALAAADAHANRLAAAAAPPAVVALARADLLDLASATLQTLADAADPATRRTWRVALVPLLPPADDERARAWLEAAEVDPDLRSVAVTTHLDRLLARGRFLEAGDLADDAADVPAAAAARERFAPLLADPTELPLRFTATAGWSDLDPIALRADPGAGALAIHAHTPGPLVAWTLTPAGDRLLLDLDLTPHPTDPGALELRLIAGAVATSATLHLDRMHRLTCAGATPTFKIATGGLHLQLDLDLRAGVLACRLGDDPPVRAPRTDPAPSGPLRLELHAGDAAHVTLTRLAVTGARPTPTTPTPLDRARARLVDGDAAAAAAAYAALASPPALEQAVAAIRRGPWTDAASSPIKRAAADDLRRWLRADPALAPALRHLLGDAAYLKILADAWADELGAGVPHLELDRVVLAEPDLEARCTIAACAPLLRIRGRALAPRDPAAARRALEAALALADRGLAGPILVELAALKGGAGESD